MMFDIKSSAIVKYSATKSPARYSELATNTNINSPPADWLHGRFATKEPWAPGQGVHRGKEFSSFSMANSYIDNVGKVDVVTDAENVKKLLKMNFSKAPVSMMVHRIGRTLLIDNLDVYKRVLFAQDQDWKWLKEFINKNVMPLDQDANSALLPVGGGALSRKDIEENLMLSKFLYHSIDNLKETEIKQDASSNENNLPTTVLLDPLVSEADDFANQSNFERNILWNFEDIRMLIGTDMPIFGGGTHPCVSLRLRDMKKPINVLTGIDYWLDQLMCNVPEVVMCYHLNGIVQKYEVLQTEELPNLPGSSFNQEFVRDVAQNILSFLKSNATKEGHTYWLFKGKDDDIVKLYDLSSLCKGKEYFEDKDANPFTLPVAILLYRVAKNLLQKVAPNNPKKVSSTVYRLLTHCLELMDCNKFPQIVGSVHYLLANLYITYGQPAQGDSENKDTANNKKQTADDLLDDFDESFDQNDWYIEDPSKKSGNFRASGDQDGVSCVSIDLLAGPAEIRGQGDGQTTSSSPSTSASNLNKWKFIPNCTNVEDCWQAALEHVFKGLECAKIVVNETAFSTANDKTGEAAQASASPNAPIPLHYESIKLFDYKTKILPLAVRYPNATGWRLELTALLLVKAVSAYHLLADCAFKLENHGKALRYIKLGLLCYETTRRLIANVVSPSTTLIQCDALAQTLLPNLLISCGDIHLKLSHQKAMYMGNHFRLYNSQMYRDERIAAQARLVWGDIGELEYAWCGSFSESMEQNLQLSAKCYEKAGLLACVSTSALENNNSNCKSSSKTTSSNTSADADFDCSVIMDTLVISKRLGNVKNELGVYYMNLASTLLLQEGTEESSMKKVEKYWHKSYVNFQEGIQIFNKINDKANEALLNSNAGRLMRLCANRFANENEEFSEEEQHYLYRAIDMYQRALECVNQRSNDSHYIWESIAWELSSVYFTYATHVQERPPLSIRSREECEKDVVDLLQKSLRLVENLDYENAAKHAIYLYRSSVIHHKLASLYHNSYRSKEQLGDRKTKQIRSITELHYQKASDGFKELITECQTDFIRVQLERVALIELSLENVTNPHSKLKLFQQALQLILSCRTAFVGLCRKLAVGINESNSSSTSVANDKENGNNCEEQTLNADSSDDTTESKSSKKKITKPDRAIDEALQSECKRLCDMTIDRLRDLTKSGLLLVRTSCNKEADTNSWKEAYRATLTTAPENIVSLPSFVLNILEKLHSLSLI